MMRVASMYVSSRAAAEDVVQEAWLAVLQGINRFEERCSLKTWIFRILVNPRDELPPHRGVQALVEIRAGEAGRVAAGSPADPFATLT